MDDKLQKEITKLKNLPQYRTKSDEFLAEKATANLKKKTQADITDRFEDKDEKKYAKTLYDAYLEAYPFVTSFSDLQSLADLVYEEIIKLRIEKQINASKNDKTGETFVSQKSVEALHEIQNQISVLKTKLGIDREEDTNKELTGLQELQKRFHMHIQKYKNEFECKCASCGSMLLLRRRVKDFDVLVHPHFAGTTLYNKPLLDLVKAGVITKEQAAPVLDTSPHMIQWQLEHENDILK